VVCVDDGCGDVSCVFCGRGGRFLAGSKVWSGIKLVSLRQEFRSGILRGLNAFITDGL
jgi:hypothetical protein